VWIEITPLDVLLFRSPRPFRAGESFRAESIPFPPGPLPFVGAIRAKIFTHKPGGLGAYADACQKKNANKAEEELLNTFGTDDNLGRLAFRGPFLAGKECPLLVRAPMDLLWDPDASALVSYLAPGRHPWNVVTSAPRLSPLRVAKELEEFPPASEAFFLSFDHLKTYLNQEPLPHLYREGDLCCQEPRTGIKLGAGRTAEAGMLYTVDYLRPEATTTFVMAAENLPADALPASGFLALGGEGRAAWYRVCPEPPEVARDPVSWAPNFTDGRFKLVLLAPAVFRKGWLPDDVCSEANGAYCLKGLGLPSARLVAAAVGKAEGVGGWNLMHKRPRSLVRAVPAGSVYFFDAERPLSDRERSALLDKFHWQSAMTDDDTGENWPSEVSGLYRAAGFGLSVLGTWKKEDTDV